MPQIELHYTSDVSIKTKPLFEAIELLLNALDNSSGACKSRAYCIDEYQHRHIYLSVLVMQKPHRDSAFMSNCHKQLLDTIKPFIPQQCMWSLSLDFSSTYYTAGETG